MSLVRGTFSDLEVGERFWLADVTQDDRHAWTKLGEFSAAQPTSFGNIAFDPYTQVFYRDGRIRFGSAVFRRVAPGQCFLLTDQFEGVVYQAVATGAFLYKSENQAVILGCAHTRIALDPATRVTIVDRPASPLCPSCHGIGWCIRCNTADLWVTACRTCNYYCDSDVTRLAQSLNLPVQDDGTIIRGQPRPMARQTYNCQINITLVCDTGVLPDEAALRQVVIDSIQGGAMLRIGAIEPQRRGSSAVSGIQERTRVVHLDDDI